jgi:hypothetical protein
MARKTCLFFLAATVATATEQGYIDRLAIRYDVRVRNGAANVANNFGPRLEAADAIAGTVPQVYTDAIADYPDGNVTPSNVDRPEALLILPSATPSIDAATGTIQLRLVRAELDEATGLITLTDITAGAASSWASGTPAKATVDADSGLVTAANAGAGSTIITATVPYTGGNLTATRTVTLT